MDQWERALHARIAAEIRRVREPDSAQWLADRTAALGYPITRAQIANYESGRKKGLDVAELLVLAAALNMPPVLLIFPNPSDELSNAVEVLPGIEATGFDAAQWFSGLRHGFTDTADGSMAAKLRFEHAENTKQLRLWRQLADLQRRQSQQTGELTETQRELIQSYGDQIEQIRAELGLQGPDA